MTGEELFKLRETRAEKAAAAQTLQELADGENRDLNETETEEIEVLLTDGQSLTAEIRSGGAGKRRKLWEIAGSSLRSCPGYPQRWRFRLMPESRSLIAEWHHPLP